eukprot:1296961-Amphidinium_carterae.1
MGWINIFAARHLRSPWTGDKSQGQRMRLMLMSGWQARRACLVYTTLYMLWLDVQRAQGRRSALLAPVCETPHPTPHTHTRVRACAHQPFVASCSEHVVELAVDNASAEAMAAHAAAPPPHPPVACERSLSWLLVVAH